MRLKSIPAMVLCLIVSGLLGRCGFIPMAGPASIDIQSENSTTLPFAVVKLDSMVLQTLERFEPNYLPGIFADSRPPSSIRFGIGDVISVTIFEASAGGLYIPL